MKRIVIILFIVMSATFAGFAQDPHFSQFFEAPISRNPGLAGLYDGDIRVQALYRNQWSSVTVPYQTTSLNAEYKQPLRSEDYLTIGMQLLQDKAGTTNFTTTSILPVVNYHKALSGEKNRYLSLGFMGGYVQRRIDRSKMTTNNQFDGLGWNPSLSDGETFLTTNYNYWDASVGMSYNSSFGDKPDNLFYLGLAYHHFNRPKNSFYKNPNIELNAKWVLSGGIKFALTDVSFFTIQADVSRQGDFVEGVGGALYSYKLGPEPDNPDYIVSFGAYLRARDAFIPVVKLDYHPFAVAISYDANISQLKTASQSMGAIEISLSYVGFLDKGNSTRNAVLCPRF